MISQGALLVGLISGFLFGLGLIFSLGPQNLMLIRAGVARNHPLAVASTGYLSEIAFVAMGIGGLGTLLGRFPMATEVLQFGCAAFLVWCGVRTLRKATGPARPHDIDSENHRLHSAVGTMLVVTWLNPLVWIEVMFLVGVLSADHDKMAFATGFLAASAIKFYGWSFAGLALSRCATGSYGRNALDAVSGLILIAVAVLLTIGMVAP
jgi:L-lysine exporter family protein LysE/ArgO